MQHTSSLNWYEKELHPFRVPKDSYFAWHTAKVRKEMYASRERGVTLTPQIKLHGAQDALELPNWLRRLIALDALV